MGSKTVSYTESKLGSEVAKRCHLKLLIPIEVVGSVIGKGGSVITSLEKAYDVKVSLSSLKEIYPGSGDRVCLISGGINNISVVNDFIITQVSAMSDTGRDLCFDYDHKIFFERSKQVKCIIPQISASKIIGKRGANIKQMKALSGSFIQVSQSSHNVRLHERCIIVAGDLENNKKACRMILHAIADDTSVAFYQNIRYSGSELPIPSAFPTGPAIARIGKIGATIETTNNTDQPYNEAAYVGLANATSKSHATFLDAIEMTLREKAYDGSVIKQVKESFHFLIYHDILNVCSPIIMNFLSSSLEEKFHNKTCTAANPLGGLSIPYRDSTKVISSELQNQHRGFAKSVVPENTASSFLSGGRSRDATAVNCMQLWNPFSNPLISINNCAHVNVPQYPSGSAELAQEDADCSMVNGKNSGTSDLSVVGLKFR